MDGDPLHSEQLMRLTIAVEKLASEVANQTRVINDSTQKIAEIEERIAGENGISTRLAVGEDRLKRLSTTVYGTIAVVGTEFIGFVFIILERLLKR